MWRGGLGGAYLFSRPFVCGCLTSFTMLRFHTPLIKPDVRISRIRLSDKDGSRVSPTESYCVFWHEGGSDQSNFSGYR